MFGEISYDKTTCYGTGENTEQKQLHSFQCDSVCSCITFDRVGSHTDVYSSKNGRASIVKLGRMKDD